VSKSIRLHHPHFASCNYVVELQQPLLAGPKLCPTCSSKEKPVTHATKTLHLRLDANGDGFLHPDLLPALRTVPTMAGLEVVGDVDNAPGQLVGAVTGPREEVITATSREWVPGRTQQESERIAQAPFIPALTALAEMYDRRLTAAEAEHKRTFTLGK
jgi:hypothetical protein